MPRIIPMHELVFTTKTSFINRMWARRTSICGLVAMMKPSDMRKTDCPYWTPEGQPRVSVQKKYNGFFGETMSYTSMVNNQRVREGKVPDFKAKQLVGWEKVNGTPFMRYTPKGYDVPQLYLPFNVRSSHFLSYFLDGVEVDDSVISSHIHSFIPDREYKTRQEVDEPVKYVKFLVESIVAFTTEHKTHIIR